MNVYCYDYWNYVLNKEKYMNDVYSKAKQIALEAMECSTTYEKIKYVHDYLVMNVEYDDEAVAEVNRTVQKASSQQSHTVYGALVNQLAVCDGYTKAFQLIMNMLNIECEYIEGYASGEAHTWNYIKLDGEQYWMDVTWDDYNFRDENGNPVYSNSVNYDYYCISSEKLFRTHEPDYNYDIPVCDAMQRKSDEQIISVQFASLNEFYEVVVEKYFSTTTFGISFVNKKSVLS